MRMTTATHVSYEGETRDNGVSVGTFVGMTRAKQAREPHDLGLLPSALFIAGVGRGATKAQLAAVAQAQSALLHLAFSRYLAFHKRVLMQEHARMLKFSGAWGLDINIVSWLWEAFNSSKSTCRKEDACRSRAVQVSNHARLWQDQMTSKVRVQKDER